MLNVVIQSGDDLYKETLVAYACIGNTIKYRTTDGGQSHIVYESHNSAQETFENMTEFEAKYQNDVMWLPKGVVE